MTIPKLPKLLDGSGVKDVKDLTRRVAEWVSGAQDVLRALREASGTATTVTGTLSASDVLNDSSVSGATVKDALDALSVSTGVSSFNSRVGAVTSTAGDYAASQVTNDSTVTGTNVDDALDTLKNAAPNTHHTSHEAGGGDAIKLDDLAAPDNNTDLDASTSKHGLMQKYPGGTTDFLRADGSFAAPTGGLTLGVEYTMRHGGTTF